MRALALFVRTEFGKGHFYNKVYFTWMNFIVNFLLPFALLLTFNGLTLTTLCQSEIQRTIVVMTIISVIRTCVLYSRRHIPVVGLDPGDSSMNSDNFNVDTDSRRGLDRYSHTITTYPDTHDKKSGHSAIEKASCPT